MLEHQIPTSIDVMLERIKTTCLSELLYSQYTSNTEHIEHIEHIEHRTHRAHRIQGMQTWLNFANQESSNPHKHEQVDWVDSRVGQSALKFWARESALQLQYRAHSHDGVAVGRQAGSPPTPTPRFLRLRPETIG